MKISYISDIHIEFIKDNRQRMFGRRVELSDIAELFAKKFNEQKCDFGVIAGDIGHCAAEIVQFLDIVDKLIGKKIFICLGNHDFWDMGRYFDRQPSFTWQGRKVRALEEFFKQTISPEYMPNIELLTEGRVCHFGDLTIIGDCGFAGFNPGFNASCGIYRNGLKDEETEMALTIDWRDFQNKYIKNIVEKEGRKLLVITHMSIAEWGGAAHPDVYYISGHIHDCKHGEAEQTVTDRYRGDAPNGYEEVTFKFKTLEIK